PQKKAVRALLYFFLRNSSISSMFSFVRSWDLRYSTLLLNCPNSFASCSSVIFAMGVSWFER
ncbi:hypothetical protein, partial [Ferroglobus sp.]|uniref:hypothetical protein n=1 Tax=Ferroglobus sp. TaxID=2614230 RepID=UPI0025BDE969